MQLDKETNRSNHNAAVRRTGLSRGFVRRTLSLLVCVLVVGGMAVSALALDKNQIIQMSNFGLDERAIIGAIDSAGDQLELTQDELDELRNKGVSQSVIDHLRRGGYVRGASSPGAAPRPGVGPAPAPAQGNDYDALEREEREREIMEAADELNRQRELEAQREAQMANLAGRLPQGFSALRSNDNMQAARIFLEFLSQNPPKSSDDWYEARFGFAKALVQEGILSGATEPLLDVLMEGSSRPRFEESFYMLQKLSREIGYLPPVLEELTRFSVGAMSEDFQNKFNYFMGKFFFDYNRAEDALSYLSRVKSGSSDYPRALYLMGVAHLDSTEKNYEGALRNFQNAILAAEAMEDGEHEEILQLGYLALARVFYEVGLYDVALFYYQKIPTESSRNAHAVLESAWTYFMKNDFQRALGTFETLNSSYYSQWNFPDLYVLEATVYLNLCKYTQSQRALTEFRERVLNRRPELQEFLQQTDPLVYWTTIMESQDRYYDGRLPQVFVSSVLENVAFFNVYNVVKALEVEKQALESNMSVLGEFGQVVLDSVDDQLESKIQEGGVVIRQVLERVDAKLQEREITAMQISFDIDSEERTHIQQRLMNPDYVPPEAEIGTTLLIVADDWQPWPFEGEYWRDEVSNYRSQLRSECVEQ